MVRIYKQDEIEKISYSGKILAKVFKELRKEIKVGTNLRDLDKIAYDITTEYGAKPAFLGYQPGGADHPYPASICASLNDIVVHGLPKNYQLKDGDLLSVDFGVIFDGYYSDAAFTIVAGKETQEQKNLIEATRKALDEAIKYAKPGKTLGDVGWAIENTANKYKVKVVQGLVGHGVGKHLHEAPTIYNQGERGKGLKLQPGMVLAIEPMFSSGSPYVIQKKDESWAISNKGLAAHFEHTIIITEKGNKVATI